MEHGREHGRDGNRVGRESKKLGNGKDFAWLADLPPPQPQELAAVASAGTKLLCCRLGDDF